MPTLPIITGVATNQSGVTCMARILGNLGIPILPGDIAGIQYALTDLSTGINVTSAVNISPASTIFNSLVQNDPRWTRDSQNSPGSDGAWGYNFLFTMPPSQFTLPTFDVDQTVFPARICGHRFQIDVIFTPGSGQPFAVGFAFALQPTWPANANAFAWAANPPEGNIP